MFPYVNNLPLLHDLLSLGVAAMVAFLLYFCIPTFYSNTKFDGLFRSPLRENNNDVHQLENHEKDGETNYETHDKKKKKKQSKADDHLPPGSLGLPWIGETLQFALFNSCPIGTPPPFLSSRLQRYNNKTTETSGFFPMVWFHIWVKTSSLHCFLHTKYMPSCVYGKCKGVCIYPWKMNENVCVCVYVPTMYVCPKEATISPNKSFHCWNF